MTTTDPNSIQAGTARRTWLLLSMQPSSQRPLSLRARDRHARKRRCRRTLNYLVLRGRGDRYARLVDRCLTRRWNASRRRDGAVRT